MTFPYSELRLRKNRKNTRKQKGAFLSPEARPLFSVPLTPAVSLTCSCPAAPELEHPSCPRKPVHLYFQLRWVFKSKLIFLQRNPRSRISLSETPQMRCTWLRTAACSPLSRLSPRLTFPGPRPFLTAQGFWTPSPCSYFSWTLNVPLGRGPPVYHYPQGWPCRHEWRYHLHDFGYQIFTSVAKDHIDFPGGQM